MALTGRIIKIVPVTVYEGKAYDYNIIVRLVNGVKISLFAPPPIAVNDDLLGKEANFKVLVFLASSMEKIKEHDLKIIPSYDAAKNLMSEAEIYGRIDHVETCKNNPYNLCADLNIGVGSINLVIDRDQRGLNLLRESHAIEQFNVGNYVHIIGARLDLKAIEVIE
ncbi:hypothetical protein [Methanocella conradii]|uniref:hypothetical protein n=1 Tax=Methanocella conradii TaxID=1175444 RepID=UPI00157C6E38|nr:hypothetical protein [Methanocella conradii]